MKTNRILGVDHFLATTKPGMEVTVVKLGENNIGLESDSVNQNTVLLKNLSADDYTNLLKGRSYLEFWIEAIDHTKPTANNRLYLEDEFKAGIERYLGRTIKASGAVGGERNHPDITIDDTKPTKPQIEAITNRLMKIDPANTTHHVVDYKTENQKTYFKIRTDLTNPVIVKEIAIGKTPTFSIRTIGEFPLENGVAVGRKLIVITTDYVDLPANMSSRPVSSNIKVIDPKKATEINAELMYDRAGNESVIDLFTLANNEKLVASVESDNSFTLNIIEEVKEFTKEATMKDALRSIFN